MPGIRLYIKWKISNCTCYWIEWLKTSMLSVLAMAFLAGVSGHVSKYILNISKLSHCQHAKPYSFLLSLSSCLTHQIFHGFHFALWRREMQCNPQSQKWSLHIDQTISFSLLWYDLLVLPPLTISVPGRHLPKAYASFKSHLKCVVTFLLTTNQCGLHFHEYNSIFLCDITTLHFSLRSGEEHYHSSYRFWKSQETQPLEQHSDCVYSSFRPTFQRFKTHGGCHGILFFEWICKLIHQLEQSKYKWKTDLSKNLLCTERNILDHWHWLRLWFWAFSSSSF